MEVSTVFGVRRYSKQSEIKESVNNFPVDNYEVKLRGEEAVDKLRASIDKHDTIILKGFKINGVFQEADLISHWERTALEGNRK